MKSRWATDYDRGFPIKNFDCDIVAHVALNRGYRYSRRGNVEDGDDGRRVPEVYVFPVDVVLGSAACEVGRWRVGER